MQPGLDINCPSMDTDLDSPLSAQSPYERYRDGFNGFLDYEYILIDIAEHITAPGEVKK